MASVNKAIIIGNLGKDPEVRYNNQGHAFAYLTIATTHSWKDKTSGEKREETEWHSVTVNGQTAEYVGEYARKGYSIYVDGRIRTRKYTDKEGREQYKTEVIAGEVKILTMREKGTAPPPAREPQRQAPRPAPKSGTSFDDIDDPIPF